jgi:cell wall assembly regulator SMI1
MNTDETDHFDKVVGLLRADLLHPDQGIPPGVSRMEIEAAEIRIGQTLPRELKAWLIRTNAPCVAGGGFIGICSQDGGLDMEAVWALYPNWKCRGWIPVAADGSGNYYVMVQPEMAVGFIDTSSDPDLLAYVVSSGLVSFLEMFVKRARRETTWPFQKQATLAVDPGIERLRVLAPMPWD